MPLDVISYSLTKRKAEKFKQLRDTPASYTGHASKFVLVKADETGLTFGDVPPSGGWVLKEVTSDYAASSNEFILAKASANPITITLPTPAANLRVAVKKVDDTANEVIVDAGTSKIDGATTKTLKTQYEAYAFYCNGSEWFIL